MLLVTNENFEKEVLKSEIPVIIDFYADWCMPCNIFGPIFEEVSKDFEGKVKFMKVDVDGNPELAEKFFAMTIPTVVFMKDGKEVNRMVGVVENKKLKEEAEKLL